MTHPRPQCLACQAVMSEFIFRAFTAAAEDGDAVFTGVGDYVCEGCTLEIVRALAGCGIVRVPGLSWGAVVPCIARLMGTARASERARLGHDRPEAKA